MSLEPSDRFILGPRPAETHRFSTSETELFHLTIAFAVLTLDFALIRTQILGGGTAIGQLGAIAAGIPFGALAALTAFVAHEMAHKFSAQQHGFWAEFRMSPVGLFISVLTASVGLLLAAPGATVIGGMGDTREWGRTSLAGPVVNLAQGTIFVAAAALVASPVGNDWESGLLFLALLNGWFAAFNLIPLGPLDGAKVLRWDRGVWMGAFAIALAFTVFVGLLIFGVVAVGPF